ncbi:MAG: hypothetical protein M1828_004731 [Chrysothrix sp. TS-e1954]|nr:MAG: hypothetical protein M1828_004731 [Chrysothrix sp. TS-e1954]
MSSKKAIHFGGGNIGRGFVAEFLHKSGYEVVFVDVVDKLIEQIQNTPSYKVTEIGAEGETTFTIDNYRAINSKHNESDVVHEIATGDVVTCAVGPNILKFIAPVIAKGIDARKSDTPLAVIACENAIGATDTLAGFIKEKLESTPEGLLPEKARFANSAIDRIVPGQDPDAGLNVKIEKFYEWCVDASPFKSAPGSQPKIDGVHFVDDLVPYIERKLYTVNTSHATAAYYGHNRGKRTIHEAMADKEIKAAVHEALEETAHLIVNKHGITKSDQEDYVDNIVTRISNPHLEDVVERVGRAPLRKLSRKERFIGPAAELAERGDKVDALLGGLEMALRFQNVEGDDESKELAEILKSMSAGDATTKLTGLKKDHALFDRVEKVVAKVQA